jgi:glycosyltransferase involved in cell wall biosynthesis
MAEHVGAELVDCSTGNPLDRIRAGANRSFGDRPVILEGGVPLTEGSVVSILGRSGPVIALGADSTYHDIWRPLPGRSRTARLAHRVAQRFVDGTLAVSERIATIARRLTGEPVRIAHPFVEADRYEALRKIDPDLDGRRVLCVGKNRLKNGQKVLVEALDRTDANVHVDLVGPDTEDLPTHPDATRHGFVSEERLIELFGEASLLAFPALAGAFPVATLEGLRAGLPVLTTTEVGTAEHARLVDSRLVVDPDSDAIAGALEYYDGLEADARHTRGDRAAFVGERFDQASGLEAFTRALVDLLDAVDGSTTVTSK